MSIDATQFAWDPVPELQTCTMQVFSWSYQGPTLGALNISITDIDVEQQAPITSSTSSTTPATSGTSTSTTSTALTTPTSSGGYRRHLRGGRFAAQDRSLHTIHQRQSFGDYNGYGGSWLPRINQTLTVDAHANDKTWTWSSVNMTQGWYILVADVFGDGDVLQSPSSPFFVRNGTTSCITAAAAVAPPSSSSSCTLPSSSTTSTTDVASSGAAISSSPVFSHPRTSGSAIAGGVVGGAILVVGVLVAAAIVLRRRRRSSAFAHTIHDPVAGAAVPDPYDATIEQFPIQRRTTFLPLAGSPDQYVTKVVRQPLRHDPSIEDVGRQGVEPSLPLSAHAEVPQEQLNSQMEQEPAELVLVSIRASQRLPRRVSRGQSTLQSGEDDPVVDAVSSTAPPGYEQVVRS